MLPDLYGLSEMRTSSNHGGLGNQRGQHLDGPCFWSSVYIDDQLMVDRGRLTLCDDPEIREIASKYGDPGDLLEHVTHAQ